MLRVMSRRSGRPTGVSILAVLYIVQGLISLGMGILFGSALHSLTSGLFGGFGYLFSGYFLIVAIFYFVIAWGLWHLRTWARWAAMIGAVFGLLSFPLGTLLSIIMLWYLFRPEVKAAFR